MNTFQSICRLGLTTKTKAIFNKSCIIFNNNKLPNSNSMIWRHMAGHSKWQNIKSTKEAKDQEKSITNQRYCSMIQKCAMEGGVNPKTNSRLATLISDAKDKKVPQATIDNVLKRLENKKLKPFQSQISGPGGCIFIVEMECDQPNRTVHDLKALCRKVPGSHLMDESRLKLYFERKGIIRISSKKDGTALTGEKALEEAILAGAEEVREEKDENDTPIFEFIASPDEMNQVKKEFETMQYDIQDFCLEYLPVHKVTLDEEQMEAAAKLYNLLEEYPDKQKIFDNIEHSSSVTN